MPSVDEASIRLRKQLPETESENAPLLRRAMPRFLASAAVASVGAAALAPAAMAQEQLLLQGSQGSQVSRVQRALGETPTGFFGQHTRADVISFQQNHGLRVDGIVGPQTHSALFGSGSNTHKTYRAQHSSRTQTRHSSAATSSSGGWSLPSYIVQCESGGNYSAVNPSTGAGGAYQIMPSTWRAYGGSGSPQSASKQQQDAIASKIYHSQGSSPWSCAK